MRRKAKAKVAVGGKRVGNKRSDYRWEAPDGTIWASLFEFKVYTALVGAGLPVIKANESYTVKYTSSFPHGYCGDCKSENVIQDRTFTPDLVLPGYVIEAKGYLRADRRKLLRDMRRCLPDYPLRFILERDYKATAKLKLSEWIAKYLRCPVVVWAGSIPEDWK
jgi:hypothetical protein